MPIGVTNNAGAVAEGGALTQEQVQRILVQPLQAASVFLGLPGLQFFDTNGSPVRIPKQAPPTSPSWVGESELIPQVSPVFDAVHLLPSTMKSVKVITTFSSELLRQSVVSLDTALQSRLVVDVAGTIDQALLASTTTDGTIPTGVFSYPGVQVMPAVGAANLDAILDAWALLMAANVNPMNARLLMRPESYIALRKIKGGTGLNSYVLGGVDATQAVGPNIMGLPVTLTNRIPVTGASGSKKTQMMLADFSQVAVARDLTPSVKILSELYADHDQTGIRTIARYDAGPLNAAALVRLDGVNATG